MKKPIKGSMTPDEMRKLANQLKAQADIDEAPLRKAERTRKIAELNKKYAGTAWLDPNYCNPRRRMWATKILRFYPAQSIHSGECGIFYTYQTLCITAAGSEREVGLTPRRQADWYNEKCANVDPAFALPAAKFDKYAEAVSLFSAAAAKDLARIRAKPRK